jgi:predicted ATP-binding protein involved in virulence
MKLIQKMDEFFPKEQIIATTHSPIIINEMDKKYLCDLRQYIKK